MTNPLKAVGRWLGRLLTRGYDGGKLNSQTRYMQARAQSENGIPWGEIQQLRQRSWELYRNNSAARKLIRSLESRVVGCGLIPEPQIMDRAGEPLDDINRRAKQIFERFARSSDYLGAPGRGGQPYNGQAKTVLRSVILSGDVLAQNIPTQDDFPLRIKLIHGERVADGFSAAFSSLVPPDHIIFRGIEFDSQGKRVAYWILPVHPGSAADFRSFASISSSEPVRVPLESNDILHPLMVEDVDQVRGVPWFAPLLLSARNVADYVEDELRAAALSACVVGGYYLQSASTPIGGASPAGWDGTDGDGNRISHLPSGLFVRFGSKDDKLEMINPMRPNANAEAFVSFLQRGLATGFPGTKSSTITGDYRNSSFSSERSAENDAWPEVEGLQEWICASFCAPTYEAVLKTAVLTGDLSFANADPLTYYDATWSGPVALSINPKDDAEAGQLRIKIGQSSPQKEAAQAGTRWTENVDELAAYCAYLREKLSAAGVTDEVIDAALAEILGGKPLSPPAPAGSPTKPRSWVGRNGEDLSRAQ